MYMIVQDIHCGSFYTWIDLKLYDLMSVLCWMTFDGNHWSIYSWIAHKRCCVKECKHFDNKIQGKHVINLDIYSTANIYFLTVVNTNGLFDTRWSVQRATRAQCLTRFNAVRSCRTTAAADITHAALNTFWQQNRKCGVCLM